MAIKNIGGITFAARTKDGWRIDMDSLPMHQDEKGNWHLGHYKPKGRPMDQIINEGKAIIESKDKLIQKLIDEDYKTKIDLYYKISELRDNIDTQANRILYLCSDIENLKKEIRMLQAKKKDK